MEIKRKGYVKLKLELKQANNTIKQLREANEFKRSEIESLKRKLNERNVILTVDKLEHASLYAPSSPIKLCEAKNIKDWYSENKGVVSNLKIEIEKAALLRSEIKQLRETNEFNRDEVARLISKIKLPWFLAASLFGLLIWSLLLCWSLIL